MYHIIQDCTKKNHKTLHILFPVVYSFLLFTKPWETSSYARLFRFSISLQLICPHSRRLCLVVMKSLRGSTLSLRTHLRSIFERSHTFDRRF